MQHDVGRPVKNLTLFSVRVTLTFWHLPAFPSEQHVSYSSPEQPNAVSASPEKTSKCEITYYKRGEET